MAVESPEPTPAPEKRTWRGVVRDWLRRMFGRPPPERITQLPWTDLRPVAYGDREAYWSHLTERDPQEVQLLLGLSERTPVGVTGVGYALVPREEGRSGWYPLVMLDADYLGVQPLPALSGSIDLTRTRLPASVVTALGDLLEALFIPVGKPELLSGPSPGDLVGPARSRAGPSSVGIRAIRKLGSGGWQPGFLTAGHGFPQGIGAPVGSVPKGRLKRMLTAQGWQPRIGQVSIHRAPSLPGKAGDPKDYDYAFVDLDSVDPAEWSPGDFATLSDGLATFDESREATVVCGISGRVAKATVLGALMGYERWLDCWLLSPATAFAPGDSGSIAFLTSTGQKLGLVVGRIAWDGVPHQFFVQSLERVLAASQPEHDVRVSWRFEE